MPFDVSQAANAFRVPDITGALPGLDSGVDPGDAFFALGGGNILIEVPYKYLKAVTNIGRGGIGMFMVNGYTQVVLGDDLGSIFVEINRLAIGGLAVVVRVSWL